MPQYDMLGRVVPNDDDDPPSIETAIRNLSLSNPGIPMASSAAEANAIRAAYYAVAGNEHVVNPTELMVWRSDLRQLHVENGIGGPWKYLAGPQPAAKITWRREDVPQNPSSPLVLYGQEFQKATDDPWSFSSAQNLVIPAPGIYTISFDANITGAAATAGRSFFQFSTTDGAVSQRFGATNENNWANGLPWDLRKGQQLRVQVYHEGGGPRTWSGTMLIAMVAPTPDW